MKHLIKDVELVAYLEDMLNKTEIKQLKNKLRENGELELLYHLQMAYDEGMQSYANELLGEDDFVIPNSQIPLNSTVSREELMIAADKILPPKK
jgi:hypothetical protein